MIPGAKRFKLDRSVYASSLIGRETIDDNNNTSVTIEGGRGADDEDADHSTNGCHLTSVKDKAGVSGGKYQLRPRSLKARQCYDSDWNFPDTLKRHKPRAAPPLSRYRRKTANARERYRMRQINTAFESLRGVLPSWVCRRRAASELTKITTLRLASAYIRSLQDILDGNAHQDTCSWVLSNLIGKEHYLQEPQTASYILSSSSNSSSSSSGLFKTQEPPSHIGPNSELMSLLSGGAWEPGALQQDLESSHLSSLAEADAFNLWLDNDPPRCWQPQQHNIPLVT